MGPLVTIVFLVFNRREELRESLRRMLAESDFPPDRSDVVVVDNASQDGSADMVARDFPHVRLIRRTTNSGVSGFNDGFAAATGDFVLALDDDCYLPPDGLRRAVQAAQDHAADLVSFGIASAQDPAHRFDHEYPTGLLSFWGCAVLIRGTVLRALGGYDPEIFVWANETELMVRFLDAGFRHLHLPEVVAVHMKSPDGTALGYITSWSYGMNFRHFGYIAGKLLRPADALAVLAAVLGWSIRDALRIHPDALKGTGAALHGFARGLRRRAPVGRAAVSRVYRENFHSFTGPWRISRPPGRLVLELPREWVRARRGQPPGEGHAGRYPQYMAQRARFYPTGAASLQL